MTDFERLMFLFDKEECPAKFLDRRTERAFAEYLLSNGCMIIPFEINPLTIRRYAYWLYTRQAFKRRFRCSRCLGYFETDTEFCPGCKAEMINARKKVAK